MQRDDWTHWLFLLLALCVGTAHAKDLPQHPRLLWPRDMTATVVNRVASDPIDAELMRDFVERGQALLTTQPVERVLQGKRLLDVSRTAIDRVMLLAFLYRVTGEKVYLTRAEAELVAIADFSDWHPDHFLDVAEMTTAAAIGYDWLYDVLTPLVRQKLRDAIRAKGLELIFGKDGMSAVDRSNNWSSVCNGGAVLGALAIYEDAPALAKRVLKVVAEHAAKGLVAYEPEGAYPEGPSYWDYGTTYAVFMIDALRTSTGNDFGFANGAGFKATPVFMEEATGPSGKQFNYSDGSERRSVAVAMYWFGFGSDEDALLRSELAKPGPFHGGRFDPLIVAWRDKSAPRKQPPLVWQSHNGNPVAFIRTSWDAKRSIFLGIKAGHADASHGHMDAGSFVLDIDGRRWASDLNKRDYNELESAGVDYWNLKQDSTRWKVFETGPFSHNVLTIDGGLHDVHGPAPFVHEAPHAVVDLAKTLRVAKATRSFDVSDDAVVITDTLDGARANADVRWAMTTKAKVTVAGNTAHLDLDGGRVAVSFTGTVKLSVEELTTNAPPYQIPIANYRQLIVHAIADKQGAARIVARVTRG